jgi:ADP-ribosylglycohydrolase
MYNISQCTGCLIGGAIGDALGYSVEFMKRHEILLKYGPKGIEDLILNDDGKAIISDDTQMTLFTAEGILRAETRAMRKGICHMPTVVYHAYLRWLFTQESCKIKDKDWVYDGRLIQEKKLYVRRAPGNTCLNALRNGQMGTIESPINDSKGCGGIMRVAPVGLYVMKSEAFKYGCELAAITHGHPSGYLSAGVLSHIIASIIDGTDLIEAIQEAAKLLKTYDNHEECSAAIQKAVSLAEEDIKAEDAIQKLGQGWVGEEAMAIALYCSLKYRNDFQSAIIAAVNHDGDSDSTGAITGNILGALLGEEYLPPKWKNHVELEELIRDIAVDLHDRHKDTDEWWDKYPGY